MHNIFAIITNLVLSTSIVKMVIRNKSRSYIIESLIKKKQIDKGLKKVDVTEKQHQHKNDEKSLEVEQKGDHDVKNTSSIISCSSVGTTNKDCCRALNAKERSHSIEKNQRRALNLKKISHLPKSCAMKKCDEDQHDKNKVLPPILKSVNSSSTTLTSSISRREKISKAMKTIDLHRRRNKSLRDGEFVSKSSNDSFQDTSSLKSFPSSTTPLCILTDLARVSDAVKKTSNTPGKSSPESSQRYKGDSLSQNIVKVGTSNSDRTSEYKRDLISKRSETSHGSTQYSSFPRNTPSCSSKESLDFPKYGQYSLKQGDKMRIVLVEKSSCHSEETIGSKQVNLSSLENRAKTMSSKKSNESQVSSYITSKDKTSPRRGGASLVEGMSSIDQQCVNVKTKAVGVKQSLIKRESVQIKTSNVQGAKQNSSVSTRKDDRPTPAQVAKTKTMNVRDALSKSSSSIGSEKLLIADSFFSNPTIKTSKHVQNVIGRSLSYEVDIVDSGNGFEAEYKNYLHDYNLEQDMSVLNCSRDSLHSTVGLRTYSTTCTESRTLNSLCTVSNSGSYDGVKYKSCSKNPKPAEEDKPSMSFSDSDTSYSASYDDSITLYDDTSRSGYSHRSMGNNSKFFFSSWCM